MHAPCPRPLPRRPPPSAGRSPDRTAGGGRGAGGACQPGTSRPGNRTGATPVGSPAHAVAQRPEPGTGSCTQPAQDHRHLSQPRRADLRRRLEPWLVAVPAWTRWLDCPFPASGADPAQAIGRPQHDRAPSTGIPRERAQSWPQRENPDMPARPCPGRGRRQQYWTSPLPTIGWRLWLLKACLQTLQTAKKKPRVIAAFFASCARSWTRTNDPLINSQVL